MSSYESRLKSFKNSKFSSFKNRESLFAVTGFTFNGIENNDSLTCDFCEKTLEGWEISDIPVKEHYQHSKKCFIFNLKTFSSRKSSFDFYKRDVVNSEQLAKLGYFAYAIKEGHPEIFCYKCGEMCNTLNINYLQKCKEHHTICNKKENFFFLKLIKGEFNSFFDDYVKYKGSFINNSELYIDLLTGSPFLSVKEVILKNFQVFLSEIKEKMENDELKAVNEIRKEK